jgi:hypothetical protein
MCLMLGLVSMTANSYETVFIGEEGLKLNNAQAQTYPNRFKQI